MITLPSHKKALLKLSEVQPLNIKDQVTFNIHGMISFTDSLKEFVKKNAQINVFCAGQSSYYLRYTLGKASTNVLFLKLNYNNKLSSGSIV